MSAARLLHGYPVATAHSSGAMLRVERRVKDVADGSDDREELVHTTEPVHAHAPCHGVTAPLNKISAVGRVLRSMKRLEARLRAAYDLDEAKRITGQTDVDIGAALDFDRRIVARILCAEAPFEVGHLRLLPGAMMAIILGRLVARLDVASRALCADEEKRVRGVK